MRIRFVPRFSQGLASLNDVRMCMAQGPSSPFFPAIRDKQNQRTIALLRQESWRTQLHPGDLITFEDFAGLFKTGKLVDIPLGEDFIMVEPPRGRVCKVTFDSISDVQRERLSDSD